MRAFNSSLFVQREVGQSSRQRQKEGDTEGQGHRDTKTLPTQRRFTDFHGLTELGMVGDSLTRASCVSMSTPHDKRRLRSGADVPAAYFPCIATMQVGAHPEIEPWLADVHASLGLPPPQASAATQAGRRRDKL